MNHTSNRTGLRRVLLISNKVMHYRVSVYNYFWRRFREEGFWFGVRANELQAENEHRIEFDFEALPFSVPRYVNEVRSLAPDFVILFLHLKDLMLWPLLHWLKLKRIPTLIWTKGANLDDPENALRNLLFHYVHNRADGIILYSPNEIKHIAPRNQGKVTVAPNTINNDIFPSIEDSIHDIKVEFGIPFEKVVLFVGRMDVGGGRKKVDHLIEIFRTEQRPGVGLVIVGSGMAESLRGRINPRTTVYLGEVHDPYDVQISKIFRMANVFCIPGHVGLGLNQAFFWGLPVVTEWGNQPPEIHYLVHGRNGFLVPENDTDELRRRLFELLENDKLLAEFSRNARTDALERASVEGMFQGFLQGVRRLERIQAMTGVGGPS